MRFQQPEDWINHERISKQGHRKPTAHPRGELEANAIPNDTLDEKDRRCDEEKPRKQVSRRIYPCKEQPVVADAHKRPQEYQDAGNTSPGPPSPAENEGDGNESERDSQDLQGPNTLVVFSKYLQELSSCEWQFHAISG